MRNNGNLLFRMVVAAVLGAWCTTSAAQWYYSQETDRMSGLQIKRAMMESVNSLSLGFPYAGLNHANLIVYQHPKDGLNAYLQITKGQIPCTLGCTGQVRFDDGKPQSIRLDPPDDHDSRVVFIRNSRAFVASAKKAKRILFQVTMYQEGSPILEFTTPNPLQWDDPPARRKKK